MSIKTSRFNLPIITLTIFFLIVTVAYPINGLESRKLDESTVPGDQGVKCTPSCIQSPPPLSPPPPSPPPPSPSPPPPSPLPPSPPVLPPPTPKKTPTQYCPPPPSPPSFIYMTGPPGNLYPVYQNFSGASRNLEVGLLALVSGFLVLAF
ncbi:hypothetical protein CRYUN_Cryun06bG0142000 [Craigia yunnanensis]